MIVETGEPVTRLRLPEPGFVLGVRYRGAASIDATRLPDLSLTAVGATARRLHTAANSGVILARFRPGGAAACFAEPLHELFGRTLPLDQLIARADLARIHDRIASAATDRERAAAIEAFLRARLRPADRLVEEAVRAIEAARGAIRIAELSRQLAISQDALEKRFRRSVGAAPKELARLLRVRSAIDAFRPGMNLARLAIETGFYDQSHLTRDVRAVTGEPPGRLFRTGAYR